MAHLIDKSALVAEIERLKNTSLEYGYNTMQRVLADSGKDISLRQLQNFIDSLEVKEVDFGIEICRYIGEYFNVYDDDNQTLQTKDKKSLIGRYDAERIARHFFELGLKAQKGESV